MANLVNDDKLGRYENGDLFATFEEGSDGLILYSWGRVGFTPFAVKTISRDTMNLNVPVLLSDGYVKVTEVPISEKCPVQDTALIDWMSGITR